MVSATEGYAVGAGGTILICTTSCTSASANWSALSVGSAPTTNNLEAVATSGRLAGRGRRQRRHRAVQQLLHLDAEQLGHLTGAVHGGTPNLYGVAVNGDGVWYAVGAPVGGNATTVWCKRIAPAAPPMAAGARVEERRSPPRRRCSPWRATRAGAGASRRSDRQPPCCPAAAAPTRRRRGPADVSGRPGSLRGTRATPPAPPTGRGCQRHDFRMRVHLLHGRQILTTAITSPTTRNPYGVSDLNGGTSAWAVGATGAAAAGVSGPEAGSRPRRSQWLRASRCRRCRSRSPTARASRSRTLGSR